MRLLEQKLRWALLDKFGYPPSSGMSASDTAFGTTAATETVGWQSDPVDCRGQSFVDLQINALAGAAPAMLYAPSTTTGLGLIFVANAIGTGGNSIQITIATPSTTVGFLRTIVTTSNSIVITPQKGDTNASVAAAVNNDANAGALVQAYPWGWTGYGDMLTVPQDHPIDSAESDLVIALSITNLAGGAASGAQAGTLYVLGSASPNTLGYVSSSAWQVAVTGAGPFSVQMQNPPRWLVAVWVPTSGSVGQIIGAWNGRATAT
jgi:hypothetical protein